MSNTLAPFWKKLKFFGKSVDESEQTVLQPNDRNSEKIYRRRWQHDKIVRTTHGVNCTGSCSWKVHVKEGIIAWETQQTDYPSTGPGMPEYEPRGCQRGGHFLVVYIQSAASAVSVCPRLAPQHVARGSGGNEGSGCSLEKHSGRP